MGILQTGQGIGAHPIAFLVTPVIGSLMAPFMLKYILAYKVLSYGSDLLFMGAQYVVDPSGAKENFKEYKKGISDALETFGNLNYHDKVSFITACATQFFAEQKALNLLNKGYAIAGATAKQIRDHALAPQGYAVTPEGIRVDVGHELVTHSNMNGGGQPQGLESVNNTNNATNENAKRILKRGKPKKIKQKIDKNKKIKSLKSEMSKLVKHSNNRLMGYGPLLGKKIKFNFDHYLGPICRTRVQKNGKIINTAVGWHHDQNGYILNTKHAYGKKIEILKYENYKNGFYKLKWRFEDGFEKWSTFFPQDWSRETVQNKIIEAYKYCKNKKLLPELDTETGNWILLGFSKCNQKIKIVLNNVGEVITAYPILK